MTDLQIWEMGDQDGWKDGVALQKKRIEFKLPPHWTDKQISIYQKGYEDGFAFFYEQYKHIQKYNVNNKVEENLQPDSSGHIYKSIFGFFDFEEVYLEQIRKAQDGYKFLEIGCLFGKSSCFFGVEIKKSGKKITLDCVDYWDSRGVKELNIANNPDYGFNNCNYNYPQHGPNIIFEIFNKNIAAAKIEDIISTKRMSSEDASKLYENNSLDFIYIDANHLYDYVIKDLVVWFPKLKVGRAIAGHDYSWGGVKRAVDEFFGKDKIKVIGDSWIYEN